jgi:hypothetical protein
MDQETVSKIPSFILNINLHSYIIYISCLYNTWITSFSFLNHKQYCWLCLSF